MDVQKVDMFIMSNGKFFEGYHLSAIRDRLLQLRTGHFLYAGIVRRYYYRNFPFLS
jgi:hypothetical protein